MTIPELADQLLERAKARARNSGRNLGDGALADLQTRTFNGAAELLAINGDVARAAAIAKAEGDIERLIDLAVQEATSIPDYASGVLGEESYFPALRFRFCPCRPFC